VLAALDKFNQSEEAMILGQQITADNANELYNVAIFRSTSEVEGRNLEAFDRIHSGSISEKLYAFWKDGLMLVSAEYAVSYNGVYVCDLIQNSVSAKIPNLQTRAVSELES